MHAIIALVLLSSSPVAFAQNKTWPGYKQTEETGIAFSNMIQLITFQLIHVGGTGTKESDFQIVETENEEQVTDEKTLNRDVRSFQVETCRRQNLKQCPVVKFFSTSTTFIENGKTQNLCRHSVHNWLVMATKHNDITITNLYPPMMIRESEGKIIYNTAYSDAVPTLDFLNLEPKLHVYSLEADASRKKYNKYFNVSDYIVYQFNESIAASVALNRVSVVDAQDTFYISGFPGETKNFGGTNKGDAPGNKLVTSSGSLIESRAVFHSTDNFFYYGNSGGPTLNQDGELIGISCMGDDEGTMSLLLDRSALESAWDKYLFMLD
jgi:Trypsin-like peptidase domain